MQNYLTPRRYVGLRISGNNESEIHEVFLKMGFENPYFYAHHSADAGCKVSHNHYAILRDYDPLLCDAVNAKKLTRTYVSKTELKGNKAFAFSFYSDTLVKAGNYMMHDPTCVIKFSDYDWRGFDKYGFEYEIHEKKEVKEDTDLEKRRRDMDNIPLSRYNLVSTLQRMDRIRKRPKRSFKEALHELLTTTRYRLNKELLAEATCPRVYVEEYEKGIQQSSKSFVDRWVPY